MPAASGAWATTSRGASASALSGQAGRGGVGNAAGTAGGAAAMGGGTGGGASASCPTRNHAASAASARRPAPPPASAATGGFFAVGGGGTGAGSGGGAGGGGTGARSAMGGGLGAAVAGASKGSGGSAGNVAASGNSPSYTSIVSGQISPASPRPGRTRNTGPTSRCRVTRGPRTNTVSAPSWTVSSGRSSSSPTCQPLGPRLLRLWPSRRRRKPAAPTAAPGGRPATTSRAWPSGLRVLSGSARAVIAICPPLVNRRFARPARDGKRYAAARPSAPSNWPSRSFRAWSPTRPAAARALSSTSRRYEATQSR